MRRLDQILEPTRDRVIAQAAWPEAAGAEKARETLTTRVRQA
jgi:hypothetical protein